MSSSPSPGRAYPAILQPQSGVRAPIGSQRRTDRRTNLSKQVAGSGLRVARGGSEVETITLRGMAIRYNRVAHIVELDNDWPNKDDLYLHSYWVPNPERLSIRPQS